MKKFIAKNMEGANKCWLLVTVMFASSLAFGEIKNGYEDEIVAMKASLKKLIEIINEQNDLTISQRKKIRSTISFIENDISYYELTNCLIQQFKIIAPELYAEIDSIKDKKRRPINVYIKFIPQDETKVKAWGTTYIEQQKTDKDGYLSDYGVNSVSIKIWIVSNALLVLAHELGHVKYQVPNLASYVEYYKSHYPTAKILDYIGHEPGDPSGTSAVIFEKRFKKEYAGYLKTPKEKIQSPLVLIEWIKKNLNSNI